MTANAHAPDAALTGAAQGDLLSALRREDAPQSRTLGALGGERVIAAFRRAESPVGALPWAEAVERLRGGVLVAYDCPLPTPVTGGRTSARHHLFVHPDGTITLLNHPRDGHESVLEPVRIAHAEEMKAELTARTNANRSLRQGVTLAEKMADADRRRADREAAAQAATDAKVRRAVELDAAVATQMAAGTSMTSEDYCLDPLLTLHALGAPIPGCVKVALWLTHSHTDLAGPGSRLGETFGFTVTATAERFHRYLPTMYAAVAWAQEPFWPRGAGPRFLGLGITPQTLRAWVVAGWSLRQAIDWLNRGARFDIAEQWRTSGDISARASELAGLGEAPGDEQGWLDVGFAPGESDPWRARKEFGRIQRLSAIESYEWHRHGVVPNSVEDFTKLPTTDEDAAARTAHWRQERSALRTDGTPYPGAIPTLARALEWSASGVPSELVLAWCRTLGDDDTALQSALAWSRLIPAQQFETIADWNATHPEAMLRPSDVARLRRIGLLTDGENMGRLTALGLSSNDILRPIQMLPGGHRWLGLDLRAYLSEAAREHAQQVATGTMDPTTWSQSSRLPEDILDGKWDHVVRNLRSIWMGRNNVATWCHVIDWLETNPTPPPPYGSGYPGHGDADY